jgi:hypothetical protein
MPRCFIKGHLLVPFGCPKWEIKKIAVANVITTGTTITSETPLAYIDKASAKPLRLFSFRDVLPIELPEIDDDQLAFDHMREVLKANAEVATDFERRFIDLYFEAVRQRAVPPAWLQPFKKESYPAPYDDPHWIFAALMPLPQAHLYLLDPLSKTGGAYDPQRMVKVDFAFWTGTRIVAIEIDGGSHIGSEDHVTKDRLLQRAGVTVIHILNQELLQHGTDAITKLLPEDVFEFWKIEKERPYLQNPLSDKIPF